MKNHSNSSQYVRTNVLIFGFNAFASIVKCSRSCLLFHVNNNIKHTLGWELTASFLVSLVSGREGISKDIEHFNILLWLIMRL